MAIAEKEKEEARKWKEEPTTEKEEKSKKKKKKKKKDKWGQPLPTTTAAVEYEEVELEGEVPVPATGGQEVSEVESIYERKKVVVGGMPYYTTEEEIRDFFEGVGHISRMQLSKFPDTGSFNGLAFLTFETADAATKSLQLDGTKMGCRFIKVERCRLDPSRKRNREFLEDPKKEEGCYSAYIGNLEWDVTENDIRGLFDQSKINSIRLAVNKKTGKFRGFGHIDFADDESLEQAILKNQAQLHGRPIKISYAVNHKIQAVNKPSAIAI